MSDKSAAKKIQLLLIGGVSALVIGYALDPSMLLGASHETLYVTPIIKKIATSSFVFASGGWAILVLCFSYWLIDVKKLFIRGSKFFIIVGMNSIFIYLFFEIGGAGLISKIINPFSKLLFSWGGERTVAIITSWVYGLDYGIFVTGSIRTNYSLKYRILKILHSYLFLS